MTEDIRPRLIELGMEYSAVLAKIKEMEPLIAKTNAEYTALASRSNDLNAEMTKLFVMAILGGMPKQ